MMTLYMLFDAIERGDLGFETTLIASKRAAQQPATNLALHTGSKLTVEEAINALIIRSANDVAVVVAETLGGTEPQFAQMMTKRAHQLEIGRASCRAREGNYVEIAGVADALNKYTSKNE